MEYRHGGDIYGNQVRLDFSVNCNPLGMPPGAKAAAVESLNGCAAYPDSQSRVLKRALSQFYAVPETSLICSNGAADLIFQCVFAQRPGRAVLLSPSFAEYEQALKAVGCRLSFFELWEEEGFDFSTERFLRFLDDEEKIDMVFLCNPNNPTGLAVPGKQLVRIARYCQEKGIRCVLDECFCDFTDDPAKYSLVREAASLSCLLIVKAFTKFYAMAGLRLGFGICFDRDFLERIEEIRQPWSVSILAQAAGAAALGDHAFAERTKKLIREERPYLEGKLRELGFLVYPSKVNYLFFSDRNWKQNKSLYKECLERGILLRSCDNYRGLNGSFYRVCVRTREENQELAAVLENIVGGRCRLDGKNNYDSGDDVQRGEEPDHGRAVQDIPAGRIPDGPV